MVKVKRAGGNGRSEWSLYWSSSLRAPSVVSPAPYLFRLAPSLTPIYVLPLDGGHTSISTYDTKTDIFFG